MPAGADMPVPAPANTEPVPEPSQISMITPAAEPGSWACGNFQSLLEQHSRPTADTADEIKWLRQTENACKAALQQFQLNSKLLSSSLTPNAAL